MGPQRRVLVAGEAAKQQAPGLELRQRDALVLRQQPEVLPQKRLCREEFRHVYLGQTGSWASGTFWHCGSSRK